MALQHAYAITNKLAALSTSVFTWSNGASTSLDYLNDGRMDRQFSVGAVASGASLVINFGSAVPVSAVAILNHNLATATAATVKVEAADNAAITVGAVTPKATTTVTTTAPRHKDTVLQFASVTKQYWRITFAWTGTFALKLGEIFACVTTALARAVTWNNAMGEEYVGSRFKSFVGETRGHYIAGPIRVRQLPFEDLSASDRDEVLTMFRATYGGASPILWVEQYEAAATAADADHQEVIYGRLEEMALSNVEFDFGRYNPSGLTIRSLAREMGA